MSGFCFWEKHKATEAHMECFCRIVSPNFSKKTYWISNASIYSEWELTFISDLVWRWLNDVQHPSKWSNKQIEIIQRIENKSRRAA